MQLKGDLGVEEKVMVGDGWVVEEVEVVEVMMVEVLVVLVEKECWIWKKDSCKGRYGFYGKDLVVWIYSDSNSLIHHRDEIQKE